MNHILFNVIVCGYNGVGKGLPHDHWVDRPTS